METHVRVLAAFHLLLGGLGLVGELVFIRIFDVTDSTPPADATDMASRLLARILLPTLLLAFVLSLSAGYGLLQRAEWARILTLVLSAFHLLNIPLGTALGIYGLWVLLNHQTLCLFKQNQAIR
jgi:hypothetical protein